MDLNALMEQLGGEIVIGRARVRHNGKVITVGRITPDGLIMTAEGQALVEELENAPAEAEAPVVEEIVTEEPVDEDEGPVDPEPVDPVGLSDGDD